MKNVMSVQVSSEGRRRIRELARREQKEVSTVARELMDYGWVFLMLRDYRAGRVSLGTFARQLAAFRGDRSPGRVRCSLVA